ncbi:MAG TPA: amidohydrolase [Gemmatimonadales bacterium]
MSALRPFWTALLLLWGCTDSAPADIVVFGKVWTGDSTRPFASAVAARGDTIIDVGDSAVLAPLVGPNTRVLRSGSGLVVPGFMDAHLHLLQGGLQLSSIDLRDADSPEEFIRRIAAFARERQPGEWITGGDWDHERWPGSPLPRREWIDSVTPANPVLLSRLDRHMALANSLALRAAGITRLTPDIQGGVIVRDRVSHEPTGILKDRAKAPVALVIPPPSDAQVDAALRRAMHLAASRGITAVASMSVEWAQVAGLFRARRSGELSLRVSLYPPMADWRRVADTVQARGPGDDWIRLAGVKGYVDGSLGSRTALLFEPYADDPGTAGLLVTSEDSLRSQAGRADSAGLQVALHAIGQRANALALDIYDSIAGVHQARDRRFRLEHAQHLRAGEVQRIAGRGVVASMQPYHLLDDGRWAARRLGSRVGESYLFRSLLDAHARLAFGSDWPVAPLDPILGIHAAVTRQTLDGKNPDGWIPAQKITVEEALRAYTTGNAYGVFAEASRGMLKPGYRADLVLLDQDLFTIAPRQIETTRVRVTIAGGRFVYEEAP